MTSLLVVLAWIHRLTGESVQATFCEHRNHNQTYEHEAGLTVIIATVRVRTNIIKRHSETTKSYITA